MPGDLRQHYLDYLAVLNERRFDDLVDFVAVGLTYNGRAITRADYQQSRREEVLAIPDLRFDVGLLVVEDERVACRLEFDCTPEGTFLGFEPQGGRVRFAEHVFYRFADGLIVEVTSLVDREAIRLQLGDPG